MGIVVSSPRARSSALVWGLLLPVVAFLGLAAMARSGRAFGWEAALLTTLHRVATPTLDRAAVWYSRIFHPQVLVVLTVLLTIGFVLRRRWRWAWAAIGMVGGALLLNSVAKAFVQRPRPALWPSLTGEVSSGFPSAHAMTSFAVAALLVLLCWRTRWRGLALVLVPLWLALVALDRLYLGVHFPTDILAGWCLSLAWVTGVWLLALRTERRYRG